MLRWVIRAAAANRYKIKLYQSLGEQAVNRKRQ